MADASVVAARAPGRALGGMVPDPALLTAAQATELVRADGRALPEFRDRLRTIPSWRNAWSVLSVWLQAVAIVGLAVWWGNPIGYVLAFLLMGRTQAQLAALMHEAAHRLLFATGVPTTSSAGGSSAIRRSRRPTRTAASTWPTTVRSSGPTSLTSRCTPGTRSRAPASAGNRDATRPVRPVSSCSGRSSQGSDHPTPCAPHVVEDPGGAGGIACGRDRGWLLVGVPGVLGGAVPHRLARHQPAALHRRARRYGRVDRSSGHNAHRPAVMVGAQCARTVSHRLAPCPPRGRRGVDATPTAVPPGAVRVRIRHRGARVPELSGVVAGAARGNARVAVVEYVR